MYSVYDNIVVTIPVHKGKYSTVQDHFKKVSNISIGYDNMYPAATLSNQIKDVLKGYVLSWSNNDDACISNLDIVIKCAINFQLWFSQAPISLGYSIKADDKIRYQ